MKKIVFLLIFIFTLVSSGNAVFAETDVFSGDDCTDFLNLYAKSENLVASVAQNEEQNSFTEDFTYFQRTALGAEWIVYKTDENLTVSTYFWDGEAISHFNFYVSDDGENFRAVKPKIKIHEKESGKWYIIDYTVKQYGTHFVKIEFANLSGNSWNPAIRSVKCGIETAKADLFDVIGTKYENDVKLLKTLGVLSGFEDKSYRPDEPVSRAEFAAAAVKLTGNAEFAVSLKGYTYFTDVNKDEWYAPYVNYLVEASVVSQDKNFCPEDNTTYAQAIKTVVKILGYGPLAELKGGFPNGYLSIAAELNLPYAENFTRGEAARLFAKALKTKMFEAVSYGKTTEYQKTNTLLYNAFNVSTAKGRLTDNGISSTVGESGILKGNIVCGNIIYKNAVPNIAEYLGHNLEIYINDDTVIFFTDKSDDTAIFNASDSLEYRNGKLKSDTQSKALNREMRVIYNGEFAGKIADINFSDLLPHSGEIKVIDDEFVIIKSYYTYMPKADGSLDGDIFDRFSGKFGVDAESAEYVRIFRDGEETSDTKIYANEVVQIAKSLGGKCVYADITNDVVIGNAESITDDEITIYSVGYKISRYFKNNCVLSPGDGGDFYFDRDRQIVWCDVKNNDSYAYIIKVGVADGMSGEIEIKALTERGEPEILWVEKSASGKDNLVPGNLVKLKKRSDGLVKEIAAATLNFEGINTCYAGTFATLYALKPETKIFIIPQDAEYDFGYKTKNKNVIVNTRIYNVKIYDCDEKYEPEVVVVYEKDSELSTLTFASSPFTVTSSGYSLNADGDRAIEVTGIIGGTKKTYIISPDNAKLNIGFDGYTDKCLTPDGSGEKIKKGDVIQFAVDEKNEITDIRFLYKSGQQTMYEWTYGNAVSTEETRMYGDVAAFFGKVINRFPGKIIASAENDWKRNFNISSANIYILNGNGVFDAEESDIDEGDSIFCAVQASVVTTVLIVK